MSDLEFIQKTPSGELQKNHLKVVFKTYHELFGEVCTGCAHNIAGYINRIKNFNKSKIMEKSKSKSNFRLKGNSLIIIAGTSKAYSNANLTDEAAISFLKENPNRKVLFAKLPENLDELINGEASEEKALKDYTVAELKEMYPNASGKNKTVLLESIQEIINESAARAESEESQENSGIKNNSEEEE